MSLGLFTYGPIPDSYLSAVNARDARMAESIVTKVNDTVVTSELAVA